MYLLVLTLKTILPKQWRAGVSCRLRAFNTASLIFLRHQELGNHLGQVLLLVRLVWLTSLPIHFVHFIGGLNSLTGLSKDSFEAIDGWERMEFFGGLHGGTITSDWVGCSDCLLTEIVLTNTSSLLVKRLVWVRALSLLNLLSLLLKFHYIKLQFQISISAILFLTQNAFRNKIGRFEIFLRRLIKSIIRKLSRWILILLALIEVWSDVG